MHDLSVRTVKNLAEKNGSGKSSRRYSYRTSSPLEFQPFLYLYNLIYLPHGITRRVDKYQNDRNQG